VLLTILETPVVYSPVHTVKALLRRLLAVFGLAPARVVATQARQLEELRASSQAWKARTGEALARAKAVERELNEHKKHAEKSRRAAEKLGTRDAAVLDLKERLTIAERELAAAREQLMTIEVKLDILEGAANVLDVRTRTALRQHPRETGAPV
jgi:chromosome segregation ATPase